MRNQNSSYYWVIFEKEQYLFDLEENYCRQVTLGLGMCKLNPNDIPNSRETCVLDRTNPDNLPEGLETAASSIKRFYHRDPVYVLWAVPPCCPCPLANQTSPEPAE